MKPIKFFLLLGLSTMVLLSCAQKKVIVAADENLENGHFDTYSTFTFASHINDASNNLFFWDSELMKIAIKNEVLAELEALGYDYVQNDNADLLVNFRVYDQDFELKGWTGNSGDAAYWVPLSTFEAGVPGNAKTYNLKRGTLLVQLADMDQGIVVWQGYASGIVKNAQFLDNDEERIDEAVEQIFDKYPYMAPGHEQP